MLHCSQAHATARMPRMPAQRSLLLLHTLNSTPWIVSLSQ